MTKLKKKKNEKNGDHRNGDSADRADENKQTGCPSFDAWSRTGQTQHDPSYPRDVVLKGRSSR